ncbi:MAG: hypothetical protein IMZ52_04795 [Actinobacteria bacterium]|nr:hypothetical protein [Actinomycetota bacterium]MBE3114784.1 hypothetical protein [Actinomycetota bacterium]
MSHRCQRCGIETIFFIWSTSAGFPVRRLIRKLNIKSKYGRRKIMAEGIPICYYCHKRLKENKE